MSRSIDPWLARADKEEVRGSSPPDARPYSLRLHPGLDPSSGFLTVLLRATGCRTNLLRLPGSSRRVGGDDEVVPGLGKARQVTVRVVLGQIAEGSDRLFGQR